MKLAAKLISLLVVAVVTTLVLESFIAIQHDVNIFKADMRRDIDQLGRTLKDLTEDVWRSAGEQRAMELIEKANDEETLVTVRWVWLDEYADDSHQPRVPRARLTTVLGNDSVTLTQRDHTRSGFLYSYVPLKLEGSRPAALEIGKSLDYLDKFRRDKVIRRAVAVIGFILAGALIVTVLGVKLIGRPLHQLIEKTRRVGAGDLSDPVKIRGHDELAELAMAVNRMCDQLRQAHHNLASETEARIEALEQLRHADRLTTVGRLGAGVAHELGTPMNVISARATMILEKDEVDQSARIIKTQVKAMTAIIRQLLDFTRKRSPDKSVNCIDELIEAVIDLFAATARNRKVPIRYTSDGQKHSARLDTGQFQQVVTNLLANAIDATPNGGEIEVSVACVEAQPPQGADAAFGRFIRVDVRDQGVGIDDQALRHVFDPFFTTKDVGEGTGLGLSIAHGIIRDHGGWIEVESEPNKGTCFSVYLPTEGD